jgi:AmmeMemoRadiSam system protein A
MPEPLVAPPDARSGRLLLGLARRSLEAALAARGAERERGPVYDDPWLAAPGATFVTLVAGGELRGCIGTLIAHRALAEDVWANARGAAFHDPRFPPLAARELAATEIEVSLLSPLEPLAAGGEREALALLRPGVDGVVLELGHRRGTFLPQVWESLPDPAEFLRHLKHKTGLPPDFWSPELRLSRYAVSKWRELDAG